MFSLRGGLQWSSHAEPSGVEIPVRICGLGFRVCWRLRVHGLGFRKFRVCSGYGASWKFHDGSDLYGSVLQISSLPCMLNC